MKRTNEQIAALQHLEAVRLYLENWAKNNEGLRFSDSIDPAYEVVLEAMSTIGDAINNY